uniref:Winged helix-turn-helix domain-containing protein n=1 Tax=Strigamia maritima TaxID=126957 RepID=T1J663_STRMM
MEENKMNGSATPEKAEKNTMEEHIVMTPTKKTPKSTTIRMERMLKPQFQDGGVMHIAGGDHKGIVINKEVNLNDDSNASPHLFLQFKVFLVNHQTNTHVQEKRILRFWFKSELNDDQQMHVAQDFFKELVSPLEFPRDYVGFIKKIIKLMQLRYSMIAKIEVELCQLEELEKIPSRPTMKRGLLITVGRRWADQVSLDDSVLNSKTEVTDERVLEMIESAYPTAMTIPDMAKQLNCTEEEVHLHIMNLEEKKLIRPVETANGRSYIRIVFNEKEVKVVRQMPTVVSNQQPTIAIITSQYCEKLAVDAMIENKDTYVRYTTVGESNVYTLGSIGAHRVVATKLPTIGHTRAATIATGNTTTRLLGCFQKVDYVFLVGLGGGIPHYTDYNRHVRLGDIVVSAPKDNSPFIYAYCENVSKQDKENFTFDTKTWLPQDLVLQDLARSVADSSNDINWSAYANETIENVAREEIDFSRPPSNSDKLYMSLGGKDVIEVDHPLPLDGSANHQQEGVPRVHFGAIGSGRHVVRDDALREAFSTKYGIVAMDHEFDAVVDSIHGNRKESYVFIRGIADYRDGTRRKEWQPYSALMAAAFTKAVIAALPPPEFD